MRTDHNPKFLAPLFFKVKPYLVATALVIGAHVLKLLTPTAILGEIPFLIFFSAVVLSGIYGGFRVGVYATTVSAVLAYYFFLPPTHTFLKGNWYQEFKIFLYVLDCLTMAAICGWLKESLEKTKRAEASFRSATGRLQAIFNTSPAAMALWQGPELRFMMVNPEYQALFGNRRLLGLPFLEALPEFHDQPFAARLLHVWESGIPYVGHEELARHASYDGGPVEDHYYTYTYVRLEDEQGNNLGVYDHAVDVTAQVIARRQAEESAARLKATVHELEQERDLREKFVAALTHDLRTPITGAKLTAQLLQRKLPDGDQKQKAGRIVNSMDRADAMIRDLLDASRIKAGVSIPLHLQTCDLAEIGRAAIEDLSSIHGDRFHFHSASDTVGICDAVAVRRIIENLASNAVKYGTDGTPVTLSLGHHGDAIEIRVHNQGEPIPAENQSELFQLFRRSAAADRSGQKGWGIGLSLVQGLAAAHGGEVGVRSVSEEGTTFWVRLPPQIPTA